MAGCVGGVFDWANSHLAMSVAKVYKLDISDTFRTEGQTIKYGIEEP